MKLKSLITLTSLVGVVSPSFCLVGCSGFQPVPEPVDESAKDYIYDRTFSIMCAGKDKIKPQYYNICWGTGWIIDDATPNDENDYTYWIATNWHVREGAEEVEYYSNPCGYFYGKGDSLYWGKDYAQFNFFDWEDVEKFQYDEFGEIDFMVAKVNFGTASSIPLNIRESLDNLNLYRQSHSHITEVADTWTPETTYENRKTYVGGYPVHGENAEWEYHCIGENWLKTYDIYEAIHSIDDYDSLIDVSPQYVMKDEYRRLDGWMDGGASGSMLVSKFNNEFKVIGIYWGGWLPSKGSKEFLPAFSIFNSTYKNFIEDYLEE